VIIVDAATTRSSPGCGLPAHPVDAASEGKRRRRRRRRRMIFRRWCRAIYPKVQFPLSLAILLEETTDVIVRGDGCVNGASRMLHNKCGTICSMKSSI